jgi:hypothetical protein
MPVMTTRTGPPSAPDVAAARTRARRAGRAGEATRAAGRGPAGGPRATFNGGRDWGKQAVRGQRGCLGASLERAGGRNVRRPGAGVGRQAPSRSFFFLPRSALPPPLARPERVGPSLVPLSRLCALVRTLCPPLTWHRGCIAEGADVSGVCVVRASVCERGRERAGRGLVCARLFFLLHCLAPVQPWPVNLPSLFSFRQVAHWH